MTPLSVVIPTLDEEANIVACLDSVAWADEVIVIDSGSSDRTRELARDSGARVVERPFTGYGDQRNHAAGLAKHDWVLAVDADERVTPALAAEITGLIETGPKQAGYRIPRLSYVAGAAIRHCGWNRDRVLRLYDRRLGSWNSRKVHERVMLQGETGSLRGYLDHHTYRSLAHFARKSGRYADLGAIQLHADGRHSGLLHILVLPGVRFLKMYLINRGFLDGVPGLIVCALGAHGVLLKYARLWELNRDGHRPGHDVPVTTTPLNPTARPPADERR